jgi:hypothetical protein
LLPIIANEKYGLAVAYSGTTFVPCFVKTGLGENKFSTVPAQQEAEKEDVNIN